MTCILVLIVSSGMVTSAAAPPAIAALTPCTTMTVLHPGCKEESPSPRSIS
uniref:Uncharacterized protein n=1 Tax=Arundo donax TaxID=35708 RepID=A0A0A9HRB2_ARUDO